MSLADLAAAANRCIGRHVGEPSPATLPPRSPLSIFVCRVSLPAGCLPPPGRLPFRIGAGAALEPWRARDLCLLEGIERFSAQFREGDPRVQPAIALPGCRKVVLPAARLRLGHPEPQDGPVDSRGCAAGETLEDAAARGVLELVEHDALAAWHQDAAIFEGLAAEGLSAELDTLCAWLSAKELRLQLGRFRHRSGAVVHLCICCDQAGRRPASGSAADIDPCHSALRACVESVVAWFNFDAIRRNGTPVEALAGEDRRAFECYLGLASAPGFLTKRTPDGDAKAVVSAGTPQSALAELVANWGADIAIFELTRAETGIAVARAVRLD
ncbi:YcaO-like family protein [Nitratireductor mangrovi]|uniref:YcaO-like family protein n=1 Tax=Nitratireductor mangrovi TaxID=2599600 RepID=A0A5B8L1S5_9HYPH|nr:YcaO-like family protein [Nitratireductor mangrovi]